MLESQHRDERMKIPERDNLGTGVLFLFPIAIVMVAMTSCTSGNNPTPLPASAPTPDIIATVTEAVREALPTPAYQRHPGNGQSRDPDGGDSSPINCGGHTHGHATADLHSLSDQYSHPNGDRHAYNHTHADTDSYPDGHAYADA